MGSSFSFENDVIVAKETPLVLRYRFLVHAGGGDPKYLDLESRRFEN
jgi:hypothetical protein